MASEIRVNKIENRSGLGTVTFADTGVDLAGIVTATTFSGSGASLTNLPAANVTGTLPAISGANLTNLPAANLTGALPAISGANLTGIAATDNVRTGILDVAGIATFRNDVNIGAAVTISESGIEASGIGITVANINGGQVGGRRNKIINGAMQVAQRGTSFTVSDDYTLDRYKFKISGGGACTITQDSTTPDDFSYSYKVDVTTADTSVASSDHGIIMHVVEGYNFAPANFGSSAAKTCTLSFYVRSNKTGTYGVAFQNSAQNRSCIQEYTISSADTWERKSITIPADTGGSWNTTNGVGLKVTWGLMGGSTYATSTLGSYNGSNVFLTSNQVNLFDNTSNEWYMTGAQVEIGSQATAFEHRNFGEELALCQRYYELIVERDEGSNSKENNLGLFWGDGTYSYTQIPFKVKKRSQPTLDVSNFTNAFRHYGNEGGANASTLLTNSLHRDGMLLYATGNAGTAGFTRTFVNGSDGIKALVAASSEL